MAIFDISEYQKQRPGVQMAPLIDIVFLTLVFFMTISVLSQMETELNISVPKTKVAAEPTRSAGDIIINITKEGQFVVNQKALNLAALEDMLRRVAELFPNQQVIIRADEDTYHKFVVQVLDVCARVNIWDISFSTVNEEVR